MTHTENHVSSMNDSGCGTRLRELGFKKPAFRAGYVASSIHMELIRALHHMREERGLKVHHLRRLWEESGLETKSYNDIMRSSKGEVGDYLLLAYLLGYQLEFSLTSNQNSGTGIHISVGYKKL